MSENKDASSRAFEKWFNEYEKAQGDYFPMKAMSDAWDAGVASVSSECVVPSEKEFSEKFFELIENNENSSQEDCEFLYDWLRANIKPTPQVCVLPETLEEKEFTSRDANFTSGYCEGFNDCLKEIRSLNAGLDFRIEGE